MSLTRKIKEQAHELGFDLVGIAPVEPVPELSFYKEWVEAGYAGKMAYLTRNIEKRTDVTKVVPTARSVIACAMIYATDHPLSTEADNPKQGWISRYAWGDDYHDILEKKLSQLFDFVRTESDEDVIGRYYVDTGPVVDRVVAKYAGIGWFGKNTCILNQQKGSWFFLGEIITNLELEYDDPVPDRCGTCNLCIEACPTDAILEPYVLDSRLCISYLTIELRDEIPVELRDQMGNHLFGCDICQDVCPWNRKSPKTHEPAFEPRDGLFKPDLKGMARLSVDEFRETFRKSPVKRSKYKGFLRNVAVAMGNSEDPEFLPVLQELEEHEEPLVAEHAKWAIDKIKRKTAAFDKKEFTETGQQHRKS
ncbi:tRNA epoxyqueuosine(34) reductase QueG [candidate division KSB1 bacterium]|nr:tRNA epoxyqueuosine(34) reductase QueG [candidate division KSB1 bacterium]NIR71394.1 tRNA epoxyqueuosine(34) reductase QueG [candidate division KSB1 bacterium]NIS26288.1 tRNA epoxyqueuosine(34) reductase QueG [candidate division KSB1 bacterium]NIT73050.1 tRNA epoxyqueuosine(34) reductase QueG [candidate division KSB1 bacterium]NIU26958.1 tRNA epoxyqueuosine(34) reductase QueG [candidate division KSB1 bacterium]